METTSVTSKGQITIPKKIRQQLGIRKGSKIRATIVGDHIELQVCSTTARLPVTGYAMLKSKLPPVPTDFDAASLLGDDRA